MRIGVVGTGYVGLVLGAGLAEAGNHVICADTDESKIDMLKSGQMTFYEPGLEPLVSRSAKEGRLKFTTDVGQAVRESDIIFISVGTPPNEDGSADLHHVLDVAKTIGDNLNGEKIVVDRSTVPVGTAAKVKWVIESRSTAFPVHVCSSPEFLKQGDAVEDFMKPDRIVIGTDSAYAREALTELFAPFMRNDHPIIATDIPSAEIAKYAANAMLATRISFMNNISDLCDMVGADVRAVRKAIGSDSRIGPSFLHAGCGYGGSCFPKDVKALIKVMDTKGVNADLLKAVEAMNEAHKRWPLMTVKEALGGPDLRGKRVAVWGLSFKPETDDMREAPSVVVIDGLLQAGAEVYAHDPEAMPKAREIFLAHHGDRVVYCESNYHALEDADALVILTEWQPFRSPEFDKMKKLMRGVVIVDGRNVFEPRRMIEEGFEYYCIGRPDVRQLQQA